MDGRSCLLPQSPPPPPPDPINWATSGDYRASPISSTQAPTICLWQEPIRAVHSSLPRAPHCTLLNRPICVLDTSVQTFRCHTHLYIMTDYDSPNSRLSCASTIIPKLSAKGELWAITGLWELIWVRSDPEDSPSPP